MKKAAATKVKKKPEKSEKRSGTGTGRGTRYALLLRGVNVGTKNSLPMADLRAMLEALGCTEVETYVQSGNAVFATTLDAERLRVDVEKALEKKMGRPIATTLRTREELDAIVKANPLRDVANDPSKLCVTFLSHAPDKKVVAPLHDVDFAPEQFVIKGREVYTWHPNGQGRSRLAAALGKLPFDGTSTTRNWNTVEKLRAMLRE